MNQTKKTPQVNISKVEHGQFLSRLQFYQVKGEDYHGLRIENDRGFGFSVSDNIVENEFFSADQFNEEKAVTRTELIEIFSRAFGALFTVEFNKQPKAKDVNEAIASLNKGRIMSQRDMKKTITAAFKGKYRKLIGYLVKPETGLGRSVCIDLEKERGDNPDWDARIVQVDHRTIKSLIFQNVKYTVKK